MSVTLFFDKTRRKKNKNVLTFDKQSQEEENIK